MRYDLLTFLLADDNQHMRMIVTEILRAIGVRRIYEANDGAQGLQVLRTHPVDIVMTDLSMTPLDGIDFVRLIRKSNDTATQLVPVIMITGHSTLARVHEARNAGVNEFLTKPITGRGVIERISLVVNHPRPFVRSSTYSRNATRVGTVMPQRSPAASSVMLAPPTSRSARSTPSPNSGRVYAYGNSGPDATRFGLTSVRPNGFRPSSSRPSRMIVRIRSGS